MHILSGEDLVLLLPNNSVRKFKYKGDDEWISNGLLSTTDTTTEHVISSIWSNAQFFGSIELQIGVAGNKMTILYNAIYIDDNDSPQQLEQLQFLHNQSPNNDTNNASNKGV